MAIQKSIDEVPTLVTVAWVATFMSLSKKTIQNRSNPNSASYVENFPKPLKTGNAVRFVLTDIMEYIEKCKEVA